ncbi:MAG: helix-turn-helix domain-containing protein [Victivallaceae bacterium]|nr:helix-turn-helix domain-containing protein [Victivallaceae bacterium]MDD4180673.1 helix-turn-helix domain-containing protein [Victivallaceae bacterium]
MEAKLKSSAPALENGLTILELLSQYPAGLSFTEIAQQVATSKSTMIRLLKTLVSRSYLFQDESNKYMAGPNMALTGSSTKFDLLRHYSQPILEKLSEQFIGNTAVLIGFTGIEMIVLNRVRQEGAVYMQEAGIVRIDFSYAPWAWIFYESMTESQKEAVKPNIKATDFTSRFKDWISYYYQHGYCFDKEYFWSHIRRVAAPVRDSNRKVIAALAVGGNKISMPDEKVDFIGHKLIELSHELSEEIKHCV